MNVIGCGCWCREPTNKAADTEEWDADVAEEMEEIRAEAEVEYDTLLDTYRSQLDTWKKQKLDKVGHQGHADELVEDEFGWIWGGNLTVCSNV